MKKKDKEMQAYKAYADNYMNMCAKFVSDKEMSLQDIACLHLVTFHYIVSGFVKQADMRGVVTLKLLKDFEDTLKEYAEEKA